MTFISSSVSKATIIIIINVRLNYKFDISRIHKVLLIFVRIFIRMRNILFYFLENKYNYLSILHNDSILPSAFNN